MIVIEVDTPSELLSVSWFVKVRVDKPGFDEFADKPFRVTLRRLPVLPQLSSF